MSRWGAMGELTGTTFAGLNVREAIRSDLVSTVYAAADPDDADRPLVLRVVAADLCETRGDERELYRRFLRRAAAALTFEHIHAPRIEEVGEYLGRGYLVASSVETVPLDAFIADHGPLALDAALELFTQVADVLDASHRAGLTHGAVNPTTLRIVPTAEGVPPQVNLTGFGIGALLELRLRRDRKRLDSTTELLYVAPEQLRSQPLTARADQYAMACAFVHTVTGSPPFERGSVGSLFGAHLFVEPTLDPQLADGPVAKALSKDARDRYATCGQFVADLERARRSAENRRRAEVRRREAVAHPWRDDDAADDDAADDDAALDWSPWSAPDGREPVAPSTAAAYDVGAASAVPVDRDDGAQSTDGDAGVDAPPSLPVASAASTPAERDDDGITYTEDGRRIIALPAGGGAATTAGMDVAALWNGRSLMATRTDVPAMHDDNSSTNGRTAPDMTYPTTGNESGGDAPAADAQDLGTGTADDNDDVPLLSDVLRHRPQVDRARTWRSFGVLAAMFVGVTVTTAVVVWLLLS